MKIAKKLVALFILSFFAVQTSFAQLEIIPKIGVNYSYFSEDIGDFDLIGKNGYQVGLDLRIGDRFYLEPGIRYFLSNNDVEVFEDDGVVEGDVDFDAKGFRVPIVVGFKVLDNEKLDLRLFGGASANLLINTDEELIEFDNLELEDNSWNLGVGVGADIGDLVTIDLRNEWGMSNLLTLQEDDSRINLLYLSVGIRL